MSKLHETKVKKLLKGRIVKGSGNGVIAKGDVKGRHVLVECKASLNEMPRPTTYLGKIAHEAKVLNRIPNLSTAECRESEVKDLYVEDILFYVPSDEEDFTIDLGPDMDPKAPRFWKELTEREYVQWLKTNGFL